MTWNPMPSKRATPCGVALGRGRRSRIPRIRPNGRGLMRFGVDVSMKPWLLAALVERDELIVRAVCGKFHETTQLAIGELFEIDGDAHAVPGFFLVAHASIIARLGGVSCR